jgi:hypothetical protein
MKRSACNAEMMSRKSGFSNIQPSEGESFHGQRPDHRQTLLRSGRRQGPFQFTIVQASLANRPPAAIAGGRRFHFSLFHLTILLRH